MEYITQRLKLKDIYPDRADAIAAEYDLGDADDIQFVRKGLVPSDVKFEDGENSAISYITTAAKDRDMEIVLPKGGILDEYRKNPVVLFGHDYRQLPIGKNEWIKRDEKGLVAKTTYANHDEAQKVYQYRKDGFPLAESIGFIPLSWVDSDDFTPKLLSKYGLSPDDVVGVRSIYDKWMLLEYSDVPVPSNPEALQLAVSKGIINNPDGKDESKELPDISQSVIKDELDYCKDLISVGKLSDANKEIAWDIVRGMVSGGDIPGDIIESIKGYGVDVVDSVEDDKRSLELSRDDLNDLISNALNDAIDYQKGRVK